MTTHVMILGAAGRMGQALIHSAAQMEGLRVVAAMEQPGHVAIGRDAGVHAGVGELGVVISDQPESVVPPHVMIDFTFHAGVQRNLACARELGTAVVLGTTGLTRAEEDLVRETARTLPVVWAPNMSVGMNVLFEAVRSAAAALGIDYDIEIVEAHHRHKKDAPSGTALKLAECAAAGRGQDLAAVACYGRHGMTGERPMGQIGVHAVRCGDIVGDHRVMFSVDGELVELCHRATSRGAFARGALRAAAWVRGRAPGLYDMRDVLGLA